MKTYPYSFIISTGIFFLVFTILVFTCGPEMVVQNRLAQTPIDTASSNTAVWGQKGDTFGGTLGPLIAWLGAALTFLAFWMQYESNRQQKDQFEKQNEKDILFKLFDDLENKVIHSSVIENGEQYQGFNAVPHVTQALFKFAGSECSLLARNLICEDPNVVTNIFWSKLSDPILPIPTQSDIDDFIPDMVTLTTDERWEYLKGLVGAVGQENRRQQDALESLGKVKFYKVDFKRRRHIYERIFERANAMLSTFLDGYLKSWEAIGAFIESSLNKPLYLTYLFSKLTKYDKVILFYYIASGQSSAQLTQFCIKYKLLDDLFRFNNVLIDDPNEKLLKEELQKILHSQ